MIAIWKKQGGTLSKYYHPQEKLHSAAYRLCKPVCSPGLDKEQENKHKIRPCCLVASPLGSRPCLSPSSPEHMLNISPVLLNLLSLMHWTRWLPLHVCLKPGLNFMFKTEPQTVITAEVSLVNHRVKEATALLPPEPTYWVPMINKVPLLDACDQHGPTQPTAPETFPHHKPGWDMCLRINRGAAYCVIQCCLLPQTVNVNHPLQLGTILVTTSS